jgi:PilZ domain.
MDRKYRRPGVARPVDDLLTYRTPTARARRTSPRAQLGRLERLMQKIVGHSFSPQDHYAFALPPETPSDRRSALRLPADERPFLASCDGLEPQVIWLEDVSRSGMRFRSQQNFACGSVVTVSAPHSFSLEPVTARIIRVQTVDPLIAERGYEYGTEYVAAERPAHSWYLAARLKR